VNYSYSADARIIPSPDILVRVINGESFMLNVQTGCYFGLNAVGARVFELLGETASLERAFEMLLLEYDVDESILRLDFDRLISELLQQGLLELQPRSPES
jgi:coenzyme PQQ synthesis protein D (PqqD)